jgi:tetratricopeptide (TPR) repeat protein
MAHYGLTEQQVYAKALGLYSNAVRLDPKNFRFASDLAQTYYVLKPLPTDEALKSWTNALTSARDSLERENVYLHFARLKMLAGRLNEARAQLNSVTNEYYSELKARLVRGIAEREDPPASTNPAHSRPKTNP